MLKARHAFKAIESVTPSFKWPVSISIEGQDLCCDCAWEAKKHLAPEHLEQGYFGASVRDGYKSIVAHYAATVRLIDKSGSSARDHAIAKAKHRATAMVLHEADRQGEDLSRPDPRRDAFIKAILG